MKVARYNNRSEPSSRARTGALLQGNVMGDLRAGYARYLVEQAGDPLGREIAALRLPADIVSLLSLGKPSRDAVQQAEQYLAELLGKDPAASGLDGEPLFTPLDACRLHAPARPTKVIAVGRNYREHLRQVGSDTEMQVPSAWIKSNNAIIGPHRDIVKPAATRQLDYETELTIVIGEKCKNVPEERAYDVIYGYMVANDISARDVVKIERIAKNQLLGKMFDTFCPTGPWIVTRDEIADPMNLRIRTRVNGVLRQDGCTKDMIWNIPQLIAYVSQMTLEPGDLITTGTPEGQALGQQNAATLFLQDGDVLESEIEGVGMLRNKVVDDPVRQGSWKW
jgi:acylpyruvate hydrolase